MREKNAQTGGVTTGSITRQLPIQASTEKEEREGRLMKRLIVGLVMVLALSTAVTVQAQNSKGKASTQQNLQTNSATRVPSACSLCYTCGGNWPIYSGDLPIVGPATERGPNCSGDLSDKLDDDDPYLCCRRNLLF